MANEEPPKRGRGRPKVDHALERQQVREKLWTPGLRPVASGKAGLPEVWLPNPPSKKGTSAYLAWAKECFLELLRHGYNFSQAADKLGYAKGYEWYWNEAQRDPEWGQEAKAIVEGGVTADDYPDLSQMTFAEFVGEYAGFELVEHQVHIAAALEDPMGKIVLILGHPESGKSTLVSLWYVLYRLAQNPDIRVALVSKNATKAQDLLTRVKRYLTEEHLYDGAKRNLIADFHGFKPPHGELEWSQDQIFVRQRKSGERDPTIQALGIGKHIYGSRLDLLILDDSLVIENQLTDTLRERLDNWMTSQAMSRAQKGQTVVNGTRLLPFDLYGQWKKSWQGLRTYRGVYIPAIYNEWTEDERVNWPEYWTLDGYEQIEEINGEPVVVGYQEGMRDIRERVMARDPNRWKLVYQQEDVEDVDNIFTATHIDTAFTVGEGRPWGTVYDHEYLVLGVDPATTGRAAAVLIAVDPTSRVRTIIDMFVGHQLGAVGIRNDLFYRFWDKYKTHRIQFSVVETNFVPTLVSDEAFTARAAAAGTQLIDHKTVGRGKKRGSIHDEEYGIAALASLFANGLIGFANTSPADRSRIQPLIDDMLTFPWADQKDALVALWVANGEANSTVSKPVDQRAAMARRGVPPNIARRVTAKR